MPYSLLASAICCRMASLGPLRIQIPRFRAMTFCHKLKVSNKLFLSCLVNQNFLDLIDANPTALGQCASRLSKLRCHHDAGEGRPGR
jgi:hypothetical protein